MMQFESDKLRYKVEVWDRVSTAYDLILEMHLLPNQNILSPCIQLQEVLLAFSHLDYLFFCWELMWWKSSLDKFSRADVKQVHKENLQDAS